MSMSSASAEWPKKLYVRTHLPDNHVDESFLKSKRINVNARIYKFWPTVVYSGLVVQQLNSVIIFALIYVYLRLDLMSVQHLMLHCVIPIAFVAYACKLFHIQFKLSKIKVDLLNAIKFTSFTYGLSPVLNSLTESISSDTIYATSTLMLVLNLIFHDYYSTQVAIMSKTFSFNTALFACICLASRFHTSPTHTFSLVTIAFILFALWPEYRRYLQSEYPWCIVGVTMVSSFVCVAMLVHLELGSLILLYVVSFFVISLVCPALLIKMQHFKK